MDTPVKENVKSKNLLIKTIQEIWDSVRRLNLKIIEIEEVQLKGPENIFNKITNETFKPKKADAYKGTRSTENTK